MNSIYKIAGAFAVFFLLSVNLAPEAQAFRGRGAAFAVGAAVGSSSSSSDAAAQQQAATAQQQAAVAQQQAAVAQQQAAVAQQQATAGAPLPMGTVVAALPAGCTSAPSGGVNYYHCGGNVYQAVYEGSTLKYVTTKPK
jgi:type II secretory pathway pseudopilin PulG